MISLCGDHFSTHPYPRLVNAVQYETPEIEAPDVPPDLILLAKNCLVKEAPLRSQLVRWDDFKNQPKTSTDLTSIKERIRKRNLRALNETTVADTDDRNSRERLRKAEELLGLIYRQIREECTGSGVFPRMEMREKAETGSIEIMIAFDASEAHALTRGFALFVTARLVHETSMVVQVDCRAGVINKPGFGEEVRGLQPFVIFEGVLDSAMLQTCLQKLLYSALDEAQQALADNEDSSIIALKNVGRLFE